METTVGQVIINDMLPEDMRDYNRTWDKKTKGKVLTDLARRHPDQFKEISHNLLRFGAKAAYETGGQSFGIEDIAPTQISRDFQRVMGQQLQDILARAYKKGKTSQDPEVQQEIADAAIPWMKKIDEGINEELGWENPFYRQAYGTGAQKPGTLRSIVGADVFYVDQNNKRVPIPVTHGYAQGLTPAEYFIQSFGTRKGMVDLQKATQDAGFLCAAKGTQVRMADMSVKQIEHIQEGDMVWGIENDLDNPKGKPVKVTHVFDNGLRNCYKTVFAGGITFISTLRHKILANNGNEHNEVIPIGASKQLRAQTIQGETIPIKEQKCVGRLHTYDIEVDSPNHLFVLANGLIISNSKQLVQIAHRLVVTDKDDDTAFNPDMPTGYPVDTDDPDNEGSCLAEDIGGYKRNTLLTPKILGDLKNRGFDRILIRSVMVGGPANGGVYANDCGVRESGSLPNKGDFVGINAVQAISEPLTQGAISSKHSGGVAGADSGKAISGFKYVNQLIQVPKHFPGGAVHSEIDGVVTKIEDAPQGGKYIYVNNEKHYVGKNNEQDIPITVKVGDRVEAGDTMTEGIPNPAMIVKYKGIGEGRRYFTQMFRDALNNAGTPIHRRNIEMLSRGLINYVKLTDEVGDYAPDDILPYSMIERDYKPREDSRVDNPESLEGQYLEQPILHYSIGTKLRPSVIKELREFGIKRVCANQNPPPFEPEMVRGMAHVSKDPDWTTRLLGAYNKDSLLEGARRGATSSAESTSYVPAITFGEGDFGHIGPLKQGSVKQAGTYTRPEHGYTWNEDPWSWLNAWDNNGDRSWFGYMFSFPEKNPTHWKYLKADLPDNTSTRISDKPYSFITNSTGKPISKEQLQPYVDTRLEMEKFAPFYPFGPMILKPANPDKWGDHSRETEVHMPPWSFVIPNRTRYYGIPQEDVKRVVGHEHSHGPTKPRSDAQNALYNSPLKNSDKIPPDVAIQVMASESPAVSSEAAVSLLQNGTPEWNYKVFNNFPYWNYMPTGVSVFGLPKPMPRRVQNPSWYNKQFHSWTAPTQEQLTKIERQNEEAKKLNDKRIAKEYPNLADTVLSHWGAPKRLYENPANYSRYREWSDLVKQELYSVATKFRRDNDLVGVDYQKNPQYIDFIKQICKEGIPIEFNGNTKLYYPDPWYDSWGLGLDYTSSMTYNPVTDRTQRSVEGLTDYYSPEDWYYRRHKIRDNFSRFNVPFFDSGYDGTDWETVHKIDGLPEWQPEKSELDLQLEQLQNNAGTYNFKDVKDPIAKSILQGNDLDQASLVRRGMTYMVDPDDISKKVWVPYAPVVAMSEQIQQPRMYNKYKQKLQAKLLDYEKHPEYFNVMKRWRITPYNFNIDDQEVEGSLTIWQMDQILKELARAEQLRQIENNPTFQ